MAILSNWNKCRQQWRKFKSRKYYGFDDSESSRSDRGNNHKYEFFSGSEQYELQDHEPRRSVSVYPNISRSWRGQSDCDSKDNGSYKRNRHNKYLYPIILCLTQLATAPATLAESVGGVSATANPIANSSGSVTNQAIQVLQGPYITNQYGGGVACQGPTANITPFITHSRGYKDPYESHYFEPQYDGRDFEGRVVEVTRTVKNWPWESWYNDQTYTDSFGNEVRAYDDGADMPITVMEVQGDGVPDNPGRVIWDKPVRTGQKDNYATNLGVSATISFPLDGGLHERCKEAAATQIQMQQQLIANKRLDFEIARLKNCGELMKAGISFHPKSPYYAVCADVVVRDVTHIKEHRHHIPTSSSEVEQTGVPSQPGSSDAAQLGGQIRSVPGSSFPLGQQSSLRPSSSQVSPTLTRGQQGVLQGVQKSSQLLQQQR